ncbi:MULTISPECIES: GNAT family N-acetyltransferase [unclassified Mesorhizobium]|uniref:GNAT family N-acetyltransferase n=1 Tax=unclassified Mesorhizobium TaxID=325217 RepID=UPI000FD7F32F|nr:MULTISPECIES: GNAT family N-acetyltransferase [unclassified Mesorhizobium]TGQ31018.1 N-acetyltransferase [Mesorhizobium sp. M00.F.Ca.ET.216.01.1.1]TIS55654.1 MAG: GNAT family N-acetyltransferase [Mesorhizobium sp.]TIS86723.1 MAG: GNAT family N-acetyltransferase [Mesorhizobium sp.]TJW06369.1 MAG: GNAT family N-acetyltransferase [Mesorhizobium sp.]
MKAAKSIRLSSFELKVGDIAGVELEKLHALSISVGWPHRAEDWQLLLEMGEGIVAQDEIGRVLVTAMWFPFGASFATVGMVITSPRLQAHGAGRWIMNNVLARVGSRNLGLSATRAAHRLYLSLGFSPARVVYQCQGEAAMPASTLLPAGASLRDIGPADLARLVELDRNAYGVDRSALLARLLDVSKGVALLREDRIQAFALCRPFGRGHVVGPVVAGKDDDAIAVTSPHVAEHAGQFLRLDTRQETGPFPAFVARSGLPVYDTVTSMWLGQPWAVTGEQDAGKLPVTYALASQAFG